MLNCNDEKFIGKKDNWTKSHMGLILLYKVQLVIPNVCTKFQNPRYSSSREIFDLKVNIQTHGKSKNFTMIHLSFAPLIKCKISRKKKYDILILKVKSMQSSGTEAIRTKIQPSKTTSVKQI